MDEYLESYSKVIDKIDALIAQLSFRNNILEQKTGDSKAFTISKVLDGRRVPLTWQEFTVKVIALVQHAYSLPGRQEGQKGDVLLVNKCVSHTFSSGTFHGKVLSVVSSM